MSAASPRFSSVDALRGFIMILMAIDHSSAFIARQHSNEWWNGALSVYTSAFPFLTRLVTHLCAPGFFFLMGAGIYWFADSRRLAGWTDSQIARRTALRGFTIFLCGATIESLVLVFQSFLKPAAVSLSKVPMPIPNDGIPPSWGFFTLVGLGLVMVCASQLLRFPPWAWLLTTALCTIATHSLLPADGKPGPALLSLLLIPGLSQHIVITYSVIPWLAVTAFGMYFGYWWKSTPNAPKQVWILGAALILTGLSLRALGGYGNIVPARDTSWIEFLNNIKYPPSLVFWTLSVGTDILILATLLRLPKAFTAPNSPLLVFGQTPLFFYLVHFYALLAIGLAAFKEAASLEMAYVVWALILVALYPVCRAYRTFKMSKPAESIWRLF